MSCAPPHSFVGSRLSNPDHEVFDLVLSDLLKNPEFVLYRSKSKIILCDSTIGGPLNALDILSTERIRPDIHRDLIDRNPQRKHYSIRTYHPRVPNILLINKSKVITSSGDFDVDSYPDVRGYVVVALPGYSQDGNSAALRFAFGPSEHLSHLGCYRLDKVDGRWIVSSRFLHYGS